MSKIEKAIQKILDNPDMYKNSENMIRLLELKLLEEENAN
jgi:hypothetical protein